MVLFICCFQDLYIEDRENPKYGRLLEALSSGDDTHVVEEIMKITRVVECVKDKMFETLKDEIRCLCSKTTNSILRDGSKEKLLTFSFKKIMNEWKEKAPLFYRFIMSVSVNPKTQVRNKLKKNDNILHAQVSAGCKLLNIYNREMKSLQQINNFIFLKGGMKKSGFARMSTTKDCQTYNTTIELANKVAESWDDDLLKWQERVKTESDVEQQLLSQIAYISDTIELCGGEASGSVDELILEKANLFKELQEFRTTMHPGYYFVGDNVDMVTKVRHMTSANQHKDAHMFQMCAYQNRVSGSNCDDSKPLQDSHTAKFSQLIPGQMEREMMLDNFSFLVARQWCTSINHLQPYLVVLPDFITHPHLRETKQHTVRVSYKFVFSCQYLCPCAVWAKTIFMYFDALDTPKRYANITLPRLCKFRTQLV